MLYTKRAFAIPNESAADEAVFATVAQLDKLHGLIDLELRSDNGQIRRNAEESGSPDLRD